MIISASYILISVVFCALAAYVFAKPALYIIRVILRGGFWSAAVYVINLITAAAGLTVGINPVTSVIYGLLGIYGVAASYIADLIL